MLNDFLNWLRQNEGATEGFQGPFFPRMPPPTPTMPGAPPMMGMPRAPQGYGGMGPLEPVPPTGDGSTPEGAPELPFGLNPQTLAPFARAMMPPIPGVGPMQRNPDQYFAEANQPPRIQMGSPPRRPAPAGAPPMMGQPDIWQHSAPPRPSATTSAPPPAPQGPGFFGRNKELIGDIGGALSAMGQGISQTPPGAGWMTGLNLGASNASRYAQGLGERKLDERLKKALVGEKEQATNLKSQLMDVGKSLPKDHPAKLYAQLGMAKEFADKMSMDPNKLFSIGEDGQPRLNKQYFDANIALNQAKVQPPAGYQFSPQATPGAPTRYEAIPGGPAHDPSKIRKEIQDLQSYKSMSKAAPIYKSMVDAAGRDNRAADVNLIYGLAKIMDPDSVVRESEMTVAQLVSTLPERWRAQAESTLKGTGRLPPEVRAVILAEAQSRMTAYRSMFDSDVTMYRGIAQRGKFDERDIIPEFGKFEDYKPKAAQKEGRVPVPGKKFNGKDVYWNPATRKYEVE